MVDSGKAVFLSYASQDAGAAKRIADALRAAGVEVWFDQNELVGGDAWDAKIRRQIGECALFVPIISANTQARAEGYFRLEWRLADKRTELMGKSKTFLLPVCIDDTRDSDADVPDSFLTVQWTRLTGGEVPPAFAARVQRLLAADERPRPREAVSHRPASASPEPQAAGNFPRWIAPAAGSLLVAIALALWQPWRKESTPRMDGEAASPTAVPLSEARKLAHQALQLLEDPNFTRETSWLADELSERALKLDSGDAEVWAIAAFASINLHSNTYDPTSARREKARVQAERAFQLDPLSVRAGLAVARYHRNFGERAEARRRLLELHQRAPSDQEVLASLIAAAGDNAEEEKYIAKLRELPRGGALLTTLWFRIVRLRGEARLAEAERIADELLADSTVIRGGYYEKLHLLMRGWHELDAAGPFIEKLPVRFRQEPAFGSAIAHYWLWRGEAEKTLRALEQVPQDYFEEYAARETKGFHAGWAHTLAGRATAAQAEWRSALALVEERLRADNRSSSLLEQRAHLLALTGQADAAREAWRLRVELGGESNPPVILQEIGFLAAMGDHDAAAAVVERTWPSLPKGRVLWTYPQLRYHPAFAVLRRDPRVQRRLNDTENWLRELKGQTAISPPAPAPSADDRSVAVLPFANLSEDKANEYFSDGISEELLNVLAKVPGLKVSARTSAFFFKGKEVPVPEIARQLGVAYVIDGSVRKQGNQVRITAQLIKAADGFHVWSDTFTRDLKDIFAVQDEIARLIAQNLSLRIGAPASAGAGPAAVNPEAYRLYLEAREAWNQRNAAGLRLAEQLLYRALELEPGFARAHAALADVWTVRSFPLAGSYSQHDSPILAKTIARAEQAVALDGNSAEAYAALGHALDRAWRFDEALRALQRATELNPNYASAHQWLGRALLVQGRMDEALASLQRAAELDPLSHRILDNYSDSLVHVGRLEEAWSMLQRAAALHPTGVQIRCKQALLLIRLGRRDEALAAARALAADSAAEEPDYRLSIAAAILWTFGERAEADTLLNRIAVDSEDRPIALAYSGRLEEFLRHLDEVTVNWCDHLWFDPALESVRTHPAFRAWVERVGLTEEFARAETWKAANPAPKRGMKP